MVQSSRFSTIRPSLRPRRAFTMMELVAVILIMSIAATISVDTISSYDASTRPERAARECLAAFRYARQLAMTTGKSTKVTFNTSTNNFSVYWMSNGSSWDSTPVVQNMIAGGTYSVTMNNAAELKGVTISLNPAGTTAFIYNPMGTLDNTSVITFTYASRTKTLSVAKVGDPQVN